MDNIIKKFFSRIEVALLIWFLRMGQVAGIHDEAVTYAGTDEATRYFQTLQENYILRFREIMTSFSANAAQVKVQIDVETAVKTDCNFLPSAICTMFSSCYWALSPHSNRVQINIKPFDSSL